MNIYVFTAYTFFILMVCSCKSDGPCDYTITFAKADVINIIPFEKNGKKLYHIELKFDASSLYDGTHFLDDLKNIEIDSAFIARNKIKKGITYTTYVSDLENGNCEKRIVSFNQGFK